MNKKPGLHLYTHKEQSSALCRIRHSSDDTCIYVKSEKSANRVMKSMNSWIERKLFLKVNATKTKVVRPNKSIFLGFTFLHYKEQWRCKPADDRKKRLYDKLKVVLLRKRAVACTLADTMTKVNQILRGWINYFRIGMMKSFLIGLECGYVTRSGLSF